MYLTPSEHHWIVDVETDGLKEDATKIFVVCVDNALFDEKKTFTSAEEFKAWWKPHFILVGHNSISFDVPILNKFWDTGIGISRCVDTYVLSMLYSPNFSGGHSLEAWGERVRLPKLEHKDFTCLSDEMITYCQRDVDITKRVFNLLTKRMKDVGFSEKSAELEHLSWHILQNKQRIHGFPFDIRRAHELYALLRQKQEELQNEVYEFWPPRLQCVGHYKRAYKSDGSFSAQYLRHLAQFPRVEILEGGDYQAYDYVAFNLGSPTQRVAKLLEAGWKPVRFTKKTAKGGGGNPKVDEESLIAFAEETNNDAVRALAKWIVINGRANIIRDWMNNYNEKTRAIHGNLWLANTLRYRHDKPNSANIPAVRLREEKKDGKVVAKHILFRDDGAWTYEARDLWTCGDPNRYSLVGVDAKGIQLRVLAHYLESEDFTEAILSEDPHAYNQRVWGLSTRALAKTIVYATIMGAGDARIAAEAKLSLAEAKEAKRKFMDRVPGFPKLIRRLEGELRKTGRITLCDGSRVLVDSPHKVMPSLLQGDESRLMRQASIFVDQAIRKELIEAVKVGDIHDEWQFVVRNEQVDLFIKHALSSFPRAGRVFDYKVPIEGDTKVGKTWAETH